MSKLLRSFFRPTGFFRPTDNNKNNNNNNFTLKARLNRSLNTLRKKSKETLNKRKKNKVVLCSGRRWREEGNLICKICAQGSSYLLEFC